MARVFLIDGTVVPRSSPFLSQPVGLLSIAAVLRQQGHAVAVHDCKLDLHTLPTRLREFAPDLVGVRALSSFTNVLRTLRTVIEGVVPGTPIVVGGPHAGASPGHAIDILGARCAVIGEGEVTLSELIGPLLDGADLSSIPGLALPDGDGGVVLTPPREPIRDLDSLPLPAYDLVPMELYFSLHHGGTAPSGRAVTVITSRGCPYRCSFCHNLFGTRFRARSAAAVLDELFYLQRRYGAEEMEIHDDAFNMDLERVRAVCHGLQRAREPLLLAFPNGLRGDRLPRETLIELRLAGTHHLALSPESASQRIHRLVGKRMDLEALSDAAAFCDELGILTLGYFMIGFPTETEEEILATIEWARQSPLHTASFFNVIAFPGTPLHAIAVRNGIDPTGREMGNYLQGTSNLSTVSDERFRQLYRQAYQRFYLVPRRLRAIWQASRHKGMLVRNALFMGTRLLSGTTN
jgi:anaerobic magnesium-protoporphyrin IX monomethyl ester cyclase